MLIHRRLGLRCSIYREGATLGFTLIELLVVVAIVSILAGFILVTARQGLETAEDFAASAKIDQLQSDIRQSQTGSEKDFNILGMAAGDGPRTSCRVAQYQSYYSIYNEDNR